MVHSAERLAPTVEAIRQEFIETLVAVQGTNLEFGSRLDFYLALAYTVRQYMAGSYLESRRSQYQGGHKVVAYLSAEYLLGKQLANALAATGLTEVVEEAMRGLGLNLYELEALEAEPGLGNGGLGRLAACFMDSLATLDYPAVGYGIRYEYGIFRQTFVDGWQHEQPDHWLSKGDPWSFPRPERAVAVGFGGRTEKYTDARGHYRVRWHPAQKVLGVPHVMAVPGYATETVNALRLWSARAVDEFDLQEFNQGDYEEAVEQQVQAETISKVLYPDDSTARGRELRLQQQYFFTCCSLHDLLRERVSDGRIEDLPNRLVVQLNDTHPTVAIPELMRILLDDHGLEWQPAWDITTKVFAYTCHTLLPEALETWPVELFGRLLPRHLEIILEINTRFLDEVRQQFPNDPDRVRRMSLIQEGPERRVRMAHLAAVGSFKINGVAELHSELLRTKVLHDFAEMWPEKFTNVTNGITPRRFVQQANPGLSKLLTEVVGAGWERDLDRLKGLEPLADDPAFQSRWREAKRHNKTQLYTHLGHPDLSPDWLLDVMVKRLHEYKRQLLKAMHLITLYNRIKADPNAEVQPRVVVFGAKAAPAYQQAKRIIRLINGIAEVVNHDPDCAGRLRVLFPPNYNVTMAAPIYAAADLSEQISLAGKEASGTGNMKLALNGALTVGTLDGANVEIRERVGAENFFLFGLTEPEVAELKATGYNPWLYAEHDPELRAVLSRLTDGTFARGDRDLYRPILESLLKGDEYLVLGDYRSYLQAQAEVEAAYRDTRRWTRMSILNVARSGFFSSDRSIHDYAREIWNIRPVSAGADAPDQPYVIETPQMLGGHPDRAAAVLAPRDEAGPSEPSPASAKPRKTRAAKPEKPGSVRPAKPKTNGVPDDLTRIEGIGVKIASALYEQGIRSFEQLSKTNETDLRSALSGAGLRFAPSLVTWPKQARYLARGDEKGFLRYTEQLTAGREA